jgi:predicted nucleic acid-binding protein
MIVDTSGVLAALDDREPRHAAALASLRGRRPRLLSPFVLAELEYMIGRRSGGRAQRAFLADVADGVYRIEPFDASDVREARDVIGQYEDLTIGLADASLVVLARRHDDLELLTLDERNFRVVRGPRDRPFTLLPADAA